MQKVMNAANVKLNEVTKSLPFTRSSEQVSKTSIIANKNVFNLLVLHVEHNL